MPPKPERAETYPDAKSQGGVEIASVIDRRRLAGTIGDDDVVHLHQEARRVLRSIDVVAVNDAVLDRAASAMPTSLGTLDAIHLAAARANGLDVVGS